MIDFKCEICEEVFKAHEYGEDNICPNCGQCYDYDERLCIVLTDAQIDMLRDMSHGRR